MQFLFLRALKPYVTLLFTGMLLFTTGCEDDDHDHDHDEDHTDADGFVLETEAGVDCLLYTSPSPRDQRGSRMPSSA